MNAYIITIPNDAKSIEASQRTIDSSVSVGNEFTAKMQDAVTPLNVDKLMKEYRLKWTYPWEGSVLDLRSGLELTAYTTADPKKRVACFLSHYTLWKKCVELNEPILILEHDAFFIRKLDLDLMFLSKYSIISINDPRGATRRSQLYYDTVKSSALDIVGVPKIDSNSVPQGLPGNSAYFIKPSGAKKLLYMAKEYGAWPNDALMCKQLLPNQLGVLTNFSTRVQGIRSTTTL